MVPALTSKLQTSPNLEFLEPPRPPKTPHTPIGVWSLEVAVEVLTRRCRAWALVVSAAPIGAAAWDGRHKEMMTTT